MGTRTLLLAAFAACFAAPAAAQHAAPSRSFLDRVPLTVSVSLPTGRSSVSATDVLVQTGAGLLGGVLVGGVVAFPYVAAAEAGDLEGDALAIALIGGAYAGGSTLGIHFAGRKRGMRASPWATGAGVVGGMVVGGAAASAFDDATVGGPLLLLLPPLGGTAGFALTRR